MVKKVYWFALLLAVAPVITAAARNETPPQPPAPALTQHISPPPLPKYIDFAGEPVPLQNFDVRESLQRELAVISYWHASMLYTLLLAHRFFPIIEPILKEEGVPDDFKYLCVAESNLQQAVSPSKAVGFWQFLEATAKEYGLEITAEVDERYHIEKATHAACAYLKKAYQKYGNWTMAAAVYNVGATNIDNQMERQTQHSYYDLLVPEETSRYVFRAVVFKMVMSRPAAYGFHVSDDDLLAPLQWMDVKITGAVAAWADFAAEHGTNYKIFKYFNPWLRDDKLTNAARQTYIVKVPKKGFRENN
jgi:hypothetical protein